MLRSFRLKTVAGFDEGEEQGKKQKPCYENDDVHPACSLFFDLFSLHLQTAGPKSYGSTPPQRQSDRDVFQVEYGSKHHKGSRRGEEERNKNSIGIFPPGSQRTAFKDKSCAGAKLPKISDRAYRSRHSRRHMRASSPVHRRMECGCRPASARPSLSHAYLAGLRGQVFHRCVLSRHLSS